MSKQWMRASCVALGVVLVGCGDGADEKKEAGTCDPHAVPCEDQTILDLDLGDEAAAAARVTNSATAGVFTSTVNASAQDAYVYVRFTEQGLEQVSLSDVDSLASTDWDIALRRSNVRTNSGTSGPSCVQTALLPESTDFATLSSIPASAEGVIENFMTASCEMIAAESISPTPVLVIAGSFYRYQLNMTTFAGPHCLAMTGQVYGITLADGRNVKLTITSYYSDTEAQADCDAWSMSNDIPVSVGTAGNYTVRWAFVD